jgi:polyhydroxybutyrate depolymerase
MNGTIKTRSAARAFGLALCIASLATGSSCKAAPSRPGVPEARLLPGDHERTLRVDGRERSYIVHVPPSYRHDEPVPLVLAFHGGATSARSHMEYCGLNEKADEAGFLVAYPNGTGRLPRMLTFNAGTVRCDEHDGRRRVRSRAPDPASAPSTLADLATGMSNGAMMAYSSPEIGRDRGSLRSPANGHGIASPSEPVSVIHFHGTEDHNAPFEGGRGEGLSDTDFYSVRHSIDRWIALDQCPTSELREDLPDISDDGTHVIRHTYGPGTGGAES